MAIPKETLLKMYRELVTARVMDDKLYELYSAGGSGMPWLHRGTGEEQIPIAVCNNLRKDDHFKPNFRTVYALFAKGLSLRDCIASEMIRDLSAVGGHYSYFCPEYGLLGHSGSLGEDVCIYVGAALSAQLRKTDQVSVCAFGDGAASKGPIHEGMVMAAAWNLPIVFLIQNNQYGEGTAASKIYRMKDLADRAKAYGFPGETVDGNDVISMYQVARKYIDRARSGGGPGLIVAETYRLRGHFEGDPQFYRPKGEAEEWWKKNPLARYQKKLMEMGILTEADVSKLEKEIRAEVDKAGKEALALPFVSYEDYIKGAIAEL
jgi:pyruvate dehydrogenase E1 component alpha subunit